jgi:hypothetical protein
MKTECRTDGSRCRKIFEFVEPVTSEFRGVFNDQYTSAVCFDKLT